MKQLLLFLCLAACWCACKKDHGAASYTTDKSALTALIDSVTTLYDNAVEGNKPGEYSVGAKGPLDTALMLAGDVNTGDMYTQRQVDNATASLERAAQVFNGQLIQEVSVANLVAQWKFDGDAADATGHGHDGTLQTGWLGASNTTATPGTQLPQLTTDRYGQANGAYDFNNGAYIEVPYATDLNPQNFTISLWIKRHNTSAGNYMFSLDRWNGYKFQLQTNNFLFLTVSTDAGIHDVDDNPGTIPLETWTHAAVSYTNGTEKFYINGALVKTVAVTGTPITLPNPVNLAIGNEMPKSAYNFTDTNDPNFFWGANYLDGSLDDIRLYNTVLSDAEVLSIYTIEKP